MNNTSPSLINTKMLFIPAMLTVLLVATSQVSFLLFHTLVEFFSVFVAILSAVVVWQTYTFTRNHFLMYLGCGYFWVATLDIVHVMAYEGMPTLSMASANMSTQFWISTRFIEAFVLLTAPFFLVRPLNRNLVFAFFGFISVSLFMAIMAGYFPVGFIEGTGLTRFKIYSEYVIILILATAIIHLVRQRRWIDQRVFVLIIAAIALTMMAELAFTYYVSVYGLSNLVGHILKLFSFWLIFIAVVRTTLREPFSAMVKSETYYDAIPDATIVVDENGTIQHVNKPALSLANKSIDDLIGQPSHDIFHNKHTKQDNCPVCRSVANREELSAYELKINDTTWRNYSTSVIQENSGLIEIIRDISALKQTEEALRKSETHMQTVIETLPDLIWLKDPDGIFLDCNRKFTHLFGAKKSEIIGKTDYDFVDSELADFFRENDKRAISAGKPSQNEEELTFADDGHKEIVETIKTPMFNHDGNLVGVLGIARNITHRKQMESQLSQLAKAVEQIPLSIIITNLDAEIVYINEAFVRTTGYDKEEAMGQNPHILHSDKTPPETHIAMWEALTNGQTWKGEYYNKRKDGTEYIEFAMVSPIQQLDGSITHYVAIQEDITEKKRLGQELDNHRYHLEEIVEKRTEELIEAQQKAEAANQSKSFFLANMSHEIRTPMNGVLGMLELLEMTTQLDERQKSLTHTARDSAKSLLTIINDILDISKIEAGQLSLENIPFNLRKIIEDSITIVLKSAKSKNIKLNHSIQNDLPDEVSGDPVRLQQILVNLVNNAVKFTPQGEVNVHVTLAEELDDQLTVHFDIKDTGIGISDKNQAILFKPFSQTDTSITRQFGGTGLGLSISKQLAEMMQGEIGMNSNEDQGSTFWFTVRFNKTTVQQHISDSKDKELNTLHTGLRVLVVDDVEINQEVCIMALNSMGIECDRADNGKLAVEAIADNHYDLVLMDCQMPVMDGFTTTEIIRSKEKIENSGHLPIIAMTANAMQEDREQCIASGMDDYLSKPFEYKDLKNILLRWLPKS